MVNAFFIVDIDSEEFRFCWNDGKTDIDATDCPTASNVPGTLAVRQHSVLKNKKSEKDCFYNSNVKTWEVSSSRLELRLTLRQITFVPFVPAFQRPLSFLGKVPFQLLRLDVVRCARFKGCQNFPFRIFPASLARMFLLFTGGRIGVTLNSIHCDSLGRPPPWGIRLGHFFK